MQKVNELLAVSKNVLVFSVQFLKHKFSGSRGRFEDVFERETNCAIFEFQLHCVKGMHDWIASNQFASTMQQINFHLNWFSRRLAYKQMVLVRAKSCFCMSSPSVQLSHRFWKCVIHIWTVEKTLAVVELDKMQNCRNNVSLHFALIMWPKHLYFIFRSLQNQFFDFRHASCNTFPEHPYHKAVSPV